MQSKDWTTTNLRIVVQILVWNNRIWTQIHKLQRLSCTNLEPELCARQSLDCTNVRLVHNIYQYMATATIKTFTSKTNYLTKKTFQHECYTWPLFVVLLFLFYGASPKICKQAVCIYIHYVIIKLRLCIEIQFLQCQVPFTSDPSPFFLAMQYTQQFIRLILIHIS